MVESAASSCSTHPVQNGRRLGGVAELQTRKYVMAYCTAALGLLAAAWAQEDSCNSPAAVEVVVRS